MKQWRNNPGRLADSNLQAPLSAGTAISRHRYQQILFLLSLLLSGCQELQVAAVRNDSADIISVVAYDGDTALIEPGEIVGTKIEDCISLLSRGGIRHLFVPNPTAEPVSPAGAYTEVRVASDYGGRKRLVHVVWLVFTDDGLFFNSPEDGLVPVKELDYLEVCPHMRQ